MSETPETATVEDALRAYRAAIEAEAIAPYVEALAWSAYIAWGPQNGFDRPGGAQPTLSDLRVLLSLAAVPEPAATKADEALRDLTIAVGDWQWLDGYRSGDGRCRSCNAQEGESHRPGHCCAKLVAAYSKALVVVRSLAPTTGTGRSDE